MVFFTTPELLEIGDLPLVCAAEKPTRAEALKYYRKCVEHYDLELRWAKRSPASKALTAISTCIPARAIRQGIPGGSDARDEPPPEKNVYSSRKLVVATGYYDLPNRLGVPGEDLPHVSHYYTEPHPFWREDVVVIGGKNSAAEAALDLYRNGARVTMVHRRAELGSTIKYWVRPDIENRIKAGQVTALFKTHVVRIEPGLCMWLPPATVAQRQPCPLWRKKGPCRAGFVLTGYHPDFDFLRQLGVNLDPATNKPALDPRTLESNVPGLYLAGVVIGGNHTSEIFIENGRFHGKQIIAALTGAPIPAAQPVDVGARHGFIS